MNIQRITVRNFGAIGFFDAVLDRSVNILRIRETRELCTALGLLLCCKSASPIPQSWVHPGTRLRAEVVLENRVYRVCATPVEGRLTLNVTTPAGQDCTEPYREALDHCEEQDALEHFDGADPTAPQRLFRYRNYRDWYPGRTLSHRTDHLTDTKLFRAHLIRYIKDFRPEPLNSSKPYSTKITPQGQFTVFHPDIPGDVFLSETEEKLFHYLCFLYAAEFWEGIERNRDLHHVKKPLLIENFLEYLDESTRLGCLMKRTLQLQRQVIIFTPGSGSCME